uniref:F-box domain-containing protein n=1 Tax=Mycena chlorophos TaxID=658473 RepID=A0ABQ0L456_MYCCL|nr:predicted protein [Mycena chlorophos]
MSSSNTLLRLSLGSPATHSLRKLNASNDLLFKKLPVELIGQIFFLCSEVHREVWQSYAQIYNPYETKIDSVEYTVCSWDCAPLLLLRICSTWRNVALSTPFLWRSIAFNGAPDTILEAWLQLAAPQNMEIKMLDWRSPSHSSSFPFEHTSSVQTLYLELLGHHILSSIAAAGTWENLRVLTLLRLPVHDRHAHTLPDEQPDILQILKNSPRLTHCSLTYVLRGDSGSTLLVHHGLTHLHVAPSRHDFASNHLGLFDYLTLPNLAMLGLVLLGSSIGEEEIDSVHSLVIRSNVNLKNLVLHLDEALYSYTAETLLPVCSSITHLDILAGQALDGEILALVARGGAPHLHALVIREGLPETVYEHHQLLLHLIRTLRSESSLQRFVLLWAVDILETAEMVEEILRPMAIDGLEIHIGTVGYVSVLTDGGD